MLYAVTLHQLFIKRAVKHYAKARGLSGNLEEADISFYVRQDGILHPIDGELLVHLGGDAIFNISPFHGWCREDD